MALSEDLGFQRLKAVESPVESSGQYNRMQAFHACLIERSMLAFGPPSGEYVNEECEGAVVTNRVGNCRD